MKLLIPIIGLSVALSIIGAHAQAPNPPTPLPAPAALPPQTLEAQADMLRDQAKQLEAAKRQIEQAQQQMARGGIGGGGGGGSIGNINHYGVFTGLPGVSGAKSPLIIRSSDADPKDQAGLSEDLSVMAHILDKTVGETTGAEQRGPQAMGIDIFTQPGSGSLRHFYLEGYGALFLIDVNFPLLAPAKKADEPKPSADSAWEEAKQELYGEPREPQGEPVETYNEDKVNKLKNALIDVLKNGANIRGLKPEESVTVCVVGAPKKGRFNFTYHVTTKTMGKTRETRSDNNNGGLRGTSGRDAGAPGGWQQTIMTLRVKKDVLDHFAQYNREDFLKQVKITTYLGGANPSGPGGVEIIEKNELIN